MAQTSNEIQICLNSSSSLTKTISISEMDIEASCKSPPTSASLLHSPPLNGIINSTTPSVSSRKSFLIDSLLEERQKQLAAAMNLSKTSLNSTTTINSQVTKNKVDEVGNSLPSINEEESDKSQWQHNSCEKLTVKSFEDNENPLKANQK